MGLQIPDLDDTTFEKLTEEARLLISRHAPGWTDHNVHDPGITFIELFAWLSEMQIYQLNRVTDAQYEKFLQMVGITPADVQPSTVLVTFDDIKAEKIIEAGTPVITKIDSEHIVFAVEEKTTLVPLALESVKTVSGSQSIDNTAANKTDHMYFFPFGEDARAGAELQIEFSNTLKDKEIHLFFDLWEEPGTSSVSLVWEYLENRTWKSFNIKKDTTFALSKSGKVVFTGPPATQIRCRLEKGRYEIAPAVKKIMLNTLSARQQEDVQQDLGKGNGFPHQVVKLEKTPVIGGNNFEPGKTAKDRHVLEVEEEDGEWIEWLMVMDFESSGPGDRHYMFDPVKGEIIFGNGLNGRIPQSYQGIKATYKTTLGSGGNIPKNQKFYIEGIEGTNPEPASGGRDAETVKRAGARARKEFNTTYRAITSEDYEKLALETPGLKIARAKAIAGYNPEFSCIDYFPGAVTVVVVPGVGVGGSIGPPVPGDVFLETVRQHLDERRLITTDLYVIAPQYVKVSVTCRVKLKKKSSPGKVKERVLEKLGEFLHPLKGGPDKKGWSFGRAVYPAEIYQLIDNVEGVDYASGVSLGTEEKQYEPGQPVKIASNALVFSGQHHIVIIEKESEVENIKKVRMQ
jgi:hypothetical protein